MTVSEHISDFLDFLTDAERDYSFCCEEQSEADKDITDILHTFEFDGDKLSDSDYVKLGHACSDARRRRRRAKDSIEALSGVVDYIGKHRELRRQLEKLLSEIRKIEKRQENRSYTPRGDIVQKTLADAEHEEEAQQ